MELTFVKRSGKFDDLTIRRADGTAETIACPKQGIIPHDMVHYAVEHVLAHRGFLSLVKHGAAVDLTASTGGGDSEEAIERLVEAFQAELWGGRVPAHELIATYEHACAARDHGIATVVPSDIVAIRERLDDLTRRWAQVAVNGALTVDF